MAASRPPDNFEIPITIWLQRVPPRTPSSSGLGSCWFAEHFRTSVELRPGARRYHSPDTAIQKKLRQTRNSQKTPNNLGSIMTFIFLRVVRGCLGFAPFESHL